MVKERISLSIDKDILQRLDRQVDHVTAFSRSEAVEQILAKHLSERKTCVILAGGEAQNLSSENTFRPLLKGKSGTLIELIVGKVRKAGFLSIIIIGAKEVLSAIYKVLGEEKDGAVIEYLEERKHLGTAKTLQLCQDRIKGTFLFLPCDHYFEIDLADMEKYHKQNRGIVTLTVYSGTKYSWNKSSIVELEGNNIISYEEKPQENKTFLTSLLIGFAEPEIFRSIPQAEISYSLQEDVFPHLAHERKIVGYLFSGAWKNVHSKKDIIF